jgi:subtilisin family serine protease
MRQRQIALACPRLRVLALLVFTLTLAALAGSGTAGARLDGPTVPVPVAAPATGAHFVTPGLLDAARADARARFSVIVQAGHGELSDGLARTVERTLTAYPGSSRGIRRRFSSLSGIAVELTGRQLLRVAALPNVLAITTDDDVRVTSYSATQQWPFVVGAPASWQSGAQAPAIAIVDSGIDPRAGDFGSRVLTQVAFNSGGGPNVQGDGLGHGTFVASIAAGAASGYAGVAPNAPLVSLDVVDDNGNARTSDVIAATDWLVAHHAEYNIRVANFSLHSASPGSIRFDPLDRAVERLWLSGVVVVAAAGNYGVAGSASGVPLPPGNDPFVITVGAADIAGTVDIADDFTAPWSAWGTTPDGFMKPDLVAPGRYMVGAVTAGATLALERPERVVAPGYMQLSGTSFSAPAVAGAAAAVLAQHPTWTPGQVKGALMVTARRLPLATGRSAGRGQLDTAAAVAVVTPPNPNLALERFIVQAADGSGPVFDAAAWLVVASADPAWDAATWTDATWTDATWTDATWTDATWTDATWTDATWTDATWTDATWTDTADDDWIPSGGYWLPADAAAAG